MLAELKSDEGSLAYQDWLQTVTALVGDVSDSASEWWAGVLNVVDRAYELRFGSRLTQESLLISLCGHQASHVPSLQPFRIGLYGLGFPGLSKKSGVSMFGKNCNVCVRTAASGRRHTGRSWASLQYALSADVRVP